MIVLTSSGRPAKLRPVTIKVLDFRLMAPCDLFARQSNHARNLVALLRTRRPATFQNRQHARLFQSRLLLEPVWRQSALPTKFDQRFHSPPLTTHHSPLTTHTYA